MSNCSISAFGVPISRRVAIAFQMKLATNHRTINCGVFSQQNFRSLSAKKCG
jgi:hypothetical protein